MKESFDAVNRFLDDGRRNSGTLEFRPDVTEKMIEELQGMSLDLLVKDVVKLTNSNSSFLVDATSASTGKYRWRSSFDIWRHVLFFNKSFSLQEVMDSLYRNRNWYIGHWCPDINRRVFKIAYSNDWDNISESYYIDEYGLKFDGWENINKE